MADHVAHTYFGRRVLETLPPDLRRLCTEDLPAYHLGLYGPDPLIFSFRTKKISDYLHRHWREGSLPGLRQAIAGKDDTARAFAAGYVLHQLLDDTVHPPIYRWMEEGSSHFRLEIALDLLLLEERRQANAPRLHTEGRGRTAVSASHILPVVGKRDYLSGLWRMAALSDHFLGPGHLVSESIRPRELLQAKELRERMEARIVPAARELETLLVRSSK